MSRLAFSSRRRRIAHDVRIRRPHPDSICPLPNRVSRILDPDRLGATQTLLEVIDSVTRKRFAKSHAREWLKTADFLTHGVPVPGNLPAGSRKGLICGGPSRRATSPTSQTLAVDNRPD